MASSDPKIRSTIGEFTPNKLTEREDGFIFNAINRAD